MGAHELTDELLRESDVAAYLVARGVIQSVEGVEVETLAGGVSNAVFAVEGPGRSLVLKQSLPQLKVQDEWLAKRERILTEGRALAVAARLSPGLVPLPLDADERACTLTIERAPSDWANWKTVLLEGEVDAGVGERLGGFLGVLHEQTWGDAVLAREFDDYEAFEQLRVHPFHRTVAERVPAAAAAVQQVIAQLETRHVCLVHGDYSPKNILVGTSGLWVLDFEVAHFGDPVFDVSFMLGHLLLSAMHVPADAQRVRRLAEAFWSAYCAELAPEHVSSEADVVAQVACLCLARVDGKSPEPILTPDQREQAHALALRLLEGEHELTDLWSWS